MFERIKSWLLLGIGSISLGACTWHDPNLHSEQLDIADAPQSLLVDVGSGDVWVRGADITGVFVEARIDGRTNHVGYALGEGSLTVFDDCHEDPCSVDLWLDVPANVALRLRTGSGDVQLDDARGEISLSTGSGDIEGRGLAGLNFSAETGSGDVRFELSPARRVHLKTGSGDVSLRVPGGAYRLDVSTGSGDQEVHGLQNDENALDAIEASTGSGDLTIIGI